MRNVVCIVGVSLFVVALSVQDAHALLQFRNAFRDKYATKHKSDEFKATVKKATCNVCHVKGAKKTVHNDYGLALKEFIEGDANDRKKKAKADGGLKAEKAELAKILAELEIAFKKVEDMTSPTGEKFGERLKEGKLPVDLSLAQEIHKKRKAEEETKGETK